MAVCFSSFGSQSARAATATWTGATDANWADANWSGGAGTGGAPATGDSLVFGAAGTGGSTLTDNLMTPGTYNIGGITFNSGAAAFIVNPGTVGTNGFTLTGNITNSSTSLETINDSIVIGAVRTVTLTAGGGNVTLGGPISSTASAGLTTSGSGTLTLSGADTYTGTTTVGNNTELTFGANNVFTSTSNNLAMGTGGLTDVIDLAGHTETAGTLSSSATTDQGGIITSSVAGGSLILNEAGTTGTPFAGTRFTGSLALTIRGSNPSSTLQITDANSNFSGGLTIQSTGAALTFAQLASTDGLTGNATEIVRFNSNTAIGTGQITLDNGDLFGISGATAITNNIYVTTNGGVIHNENSGATFSGSIASSGSTILVITSNSGNSHVLNFSGVDSGFSGTYAIDTAAIGGITFSSSATGNSNTNLLWYGVNSQNGSGTGTVSLTVGQTYTFGELGNENSGINTNATPVNENGVIQNTSTAGVATLSIGDSNSVAASFAGVIKNNTAGTLALTKTGNNTQILSGVSTYTGATTISAGTLKIASGGSLAAGSAVTINSGGTLNESGTVAGTIAVNGGGFLGGTGTASGVITVASGSTNAAAGAISLVDGQIGTLTLSNAGGLTLGGAAGNYSLLDFEANASSSDLLTIGSNALTVNAGGIDIAITSLGVTSGKTYNLLTYGSDTGLTIGTGATVGDLTLTDPSLAFGVTGVLNVTGTAVQLVTSGASAPSTAYWSGTAGAMWSGTNAGGGNFTTDAAGHNQVQAYPGSTTAVIFSGSGATDFTETLGASFDIGSLTFSGTNAVTINSDGNQLTVESGGLAVQSGAGAVAIAANVAGAGGVTNAGTLTLSGANSYSGGTVTTGTLTLGSSTALGSSNGSLAANGGMVDLNGNSVTVGSLSGSNGAIVTNNSGSTNSTLTVGSSANLSGTYAGALNNGANGKTLGLSKNGSGTLGLTGSNNYSGATLVSAGTLQLGNAYAMGSSTVTISSGATLDLDGQTISNNVTLTGAGLGGIGALINSNTGTPAEILGNIPAVNFTVGGAGYITLTQLDQLNSGTFTVTADGPGTLNFTGTTLNYLMALAVNGGTVILSKTTTNFAVDRGATITSGTLQLGASGTQIGAGSGVTVNGGVFDLNGYNTSMNYLLGTGGTVTNTGASLATLTLGTNQAGTVVASGTYAGVLQDGASQLALVKTGTDTLTLTGNNNYSGGTTVSNGTLQTASASALGNASGSLAVDAATLDMDGNSLSVGALSGNSTAGVITSSAAGTLNLTTTSSSNTSFAGTIQNGSAAIALIKAGSGALTLSSSNSYSGGTTINNGTIIQTAAGALGSGPITLGDGSTSNSATLESGAGATVANANPITIAAGGSGTYTIENTVASDFDINGNVALNNAATFETTANGAILLSGTITGTSNITVSGGGTTTKFVDFESSNASTWTGNLLITNSGVWKAGNATAIGASTTVIMDSTSTFDNGVLNLTIAGLQDGTISTGTSSVILAGAGTTLSLAGSGTYSFSGDLNNSGSLAITGGGTQTLSGASSFTGATSVTNGTLVISGSLSGTGSLSVGGNSTAELAASNAINSGANITLSSGVLKVLSNETENLSTLTVSSGSSTLSLGATGTVLDFADSSAIAWTGTLAISDWNGASAGGGSDQVIFGTSATLTNAQLADITFINGSVNGYGFTSDSAVQLADGELVAAAIPEPGTWSMLLAGSAVLIAMQRTRRRRH